MTIKWDRSERSQDIDLSRHKTWDHGYAETVYSSQSKTYARAYVLAPVASPLVNGQNFYTAITRARFGVKLWTENARRLAEKLSRNSGEKTSALEGLGRIEGSSIEARIGKDRARIDEARSTIDMSRRNPTVPRGARARVGTLSGAAARATEMLATLARNVFKERGPGKEPDNRTLPAPSRTDRGPER